MRLIVGEFIANRLTIEGLHVQKDALKFLQVIIDPYHKFLQVIQKLGDGGLGVISPVIDRFN